MLPVYSSETSRFNQSPYVSPGAKSMFARDKWKVRRRELRVFIWWQNAEMRAIAREFKAIERALRAQDTSPTTTPVFTYYTLGHGRLMPSELPVPSPGG